MPSRRKRRKRPTSSQYLSGQQWQIPLWSRFRRESLNSDASRKLLRDLILDNFVSLSFSEPHSHRDMVERITRGAHRPIQIDYLCSDLNDIVLSYGAVVFGFPGDYFDRIAQNYPHLYWWMSNKGLRMEIHAADRRPFSFDELVAHHMSQAKSNRNGRYLKQSDYQSIAEEIDKAGFLLMDHLQGKYRKELANWNQRHPGQTIKTFRDAIQAKQPRELRRGVLRRLYSAQSKLRDIST